MSEMYGSIMNRMIERTTPAEPEVGMGVTLCYWSDRVPYTIINVKSKCRLIVQEDSVRAAPTADGMGHQDWVITRNEKGRTLELIKTKKGWKVLHEGTRAAVGYRDYYYDWEF